MPEKSLSHTDSLCVHSNICEWAHCHAASRMGVGHRSQRWEGLHDTISLQIAY